jgi:hypothetical protein
VTTEHIRCLQRYFGLEPDGIRGPKTTTAIKQWQRRWALEETGVPDLKLWLTLWRECGVDVCWDPYSLTHWGKRVRPIRGIVIHHSDTANPAQTARILQSRKLSTHFEVSATGKVYQYGDPLDWVAWHAQVPNGTSIGIDLTHRGLTAPFPKAQIDAAGRLIATLCRLHGLQPRISTARAWDRSSDHPLRTLGAGADERPVALWGDGAGVTLHRQWAATACPGPLDIDALQAAIDDLPW